MLEVEVKYRVADLDRLRSRLKELGAAKRESRVDVDTYFNAPHRDFSQSDEALRLRQIGDDNYLTYKGPRFDAHTKTRREIEFPLGSGCETAASSRTLLLALGFREVATVRKKRDVFELARGGFQIELTIDDVDKVGTYAEIEVIADESALEPAKAMLLALAGELELTESERRSYLELLLLSVR